MSPAAAVDACPVCGGYVEEATTHPLDWSGRCDVYLVCEDCGWDEKVGEDSVL